MYQLYFKKEECILEIKPVQKVFKNLSITEEVWQYNNCFYFCKDRKSLKIKALELKEEWLKEAQKRLDKVNSIKI
jgi:hypothetical protein